ncbi:hypothetical protein CpipJ_CPIJ016041 [Culex quinquefasciatus]|uniref:Uncharacterized protein n=1 Tax=Culex quinquefasciatus TaxID=7176 RepID=B0X9T2_CULQU|nr:hypothetical protein CpipJ_CPIJ016041 [Culex quinquefasciatus]|eukprot:XP_001866404.1 hypothetical protein CpipJ_CPIJ016041 [Culex quinquefasciatus]
MDKKDERAQNIREAVQQVGTGKANQEARAEAVRTAVQKTNEQQGKK